MNLWGIGCIVLDSLFVNLITRKWFTCNWLCQNELRGFMMSSWRVYVMDILWAKQALDWLDEGFLYMGSRWVNFWIWQIQILHTKDEVLVTNKFYTQKVKYWSQYDMICCLFWNIRIWYIKIITIKMNQGEVEMQNEYPLNTIP